VAICTHLDHVHLTELPDSVAGCEDSPNRHASAHARSSGHPLIRSLEPGEEWSWCYVDEVALLIPEVRGKTRIPPSPLGG